MKKLILLLVLAACPPTTPPPSCASLGCGSAALCNRKGACVCNGQACAFVTDAGTP
jgi:hypothetical protein